MLTYTGIMLASSLVMANDNTASSPIPQEIARELDYFVGDWHLEGEGARGPMTSSWSIRWAPGRHCLVLEYRRNEPEEVIRGNCMWGWDSVTNELVYHALFSDRGLEHIRTKIVGPGVFEGRYSGSLDGKKLDGDCELRKEGPDQWTFKTTGAAASGLGELDVRFTRVKSADRKATEAAKCPWELVTGRWRLSDSTGYTGEVVWDSAGSGTLVGKWEDDDGGKATELAGWRPDREAIVSTGYGSDGSYWRVDFTTVTKTMIKGEMTNRRPDGSILVGTWQVTRKDDNEMPTLFQGTEDEKEVTIKGSFSRVGDQ